MAKKRHSSRIEIPAALVEFDVGGTTIWVQSPEGATILRIKCDKITVNESCTNIVSHADMIVKGEIDICLKEGQ